MAKDEKTIFDTGQTIPNSDGKTSGDAKMISEPDRTLDDVLNAALEEAISRGTDQDENDRGKAEPNKSVSESSKPVPDGAKPFPETNRTLDEILGAALEEAQKRGNNKEGNDWDKAEPDKSVSESSQPVPDGAKPYQETNQALDDILNADLEEAINRGNKKDGNDRVHVTTDETAQETNITVADEVPGENAAIRKGETLLDTYRVESDAIEGGMGAVWRVHHTGWNVDLAMKRPKTGLFQTEQQKENFVHECESWINLGLHPHIVSCYYVREIDHVPTIFSEWMDGGSLKNAIATGKLYEEDASERILDIAIQFARGLHYAHEQGLIHQDVKPDNLLLTKAWDAKVADFGLVKARAVLNAPDGDISTDATMFSAAGGYTPAYCSMEQMDGKKLTRRTDIYSWAVSVLEMYLGNRPWQNGVIAGMACDSYFPDAKIPVPQKMQDLLRNCLNADEADRPHDFAEVEKRLLEIYREETNESYPRPVSNAAADTADSLNNRALSLIDLNKDEEASQLFDRILVQIDPTHSEATFNAQLFDYFSEKWTAENFIHYLEQQDKRLATWKSAYYLGLVRELTGDRRAVADLERAYAASGDNADVAAALERAKKCVPTEGNGLRPRRRNELPWQITRIASTDAQIRRMHAIAKVEDLVDQHLAFFGPDSATEYLNEVAPSIEGFDNSSDYEKINDQIGKYGVPGKPHSYMLILDFRLDLPGLVPTSCDMDMINNCVIYGAQDGVVHILPLNSLTDGGRRVRYQRGMVSAVGLSGTGRFAAVALGTKATGYGIGFYSVKEDQSIGLYPVSAGITSVQFSLKDSAYLALGDDHGDTTIWKAGEDSPMKKIRGAAMPRFTGTGYLLVYDGTWLGKRLSLLSVPDGETLLRFDRIPKNPPSAIDICLNGRFAVSASDEEIIVWDQDGHVKGTISAGYDPVTALCCCSDNRYFYSGDKKGVIKLWNADTLECVWEFTEHSGAITSLCSSADMRYMASTARDGRCILWKIIWNYQKRLSR